MAENKDYMIRATAADGMIRAFAATTRNTVEAARQAHNTSPVATAALGRLMTGALMMGYDMKNDPDLLTLRINCDGPIGGLLVTADHNGHVKGYVHNPDVILPPNSKGKLDVGGALHLGILSVIRDTGLKEPYIGETILVSGEIAEDLTYYFANSEQVPSSVALGVLMNKDNTVRQAGGFIIQLMPGASDEIIDMLESRLKGIDSMTAMLDRGMSPEDILGHILGELNLEINEKHDCSFYCGCTRERLEQALISTGRKELEEMISEDKPIEMQCHFCGKKYEFSVEELTKLLEKAV
jgi:molecular chaperone Hsp33